MRRMRLPPPSACSVSCALSAVARNFEHALANAAPEAEGLALQVQSEARAAIETLDALLCEYRTQAA